MSTIAKRKNQYVRLKIDILILGVDVATDILSTSDEGKYLPDKDWGSWEDRK